ncbi:MAG TPA: hypothetical protein VK308_16500 [Pyrinomonadaceae bacterium]|nr:hypothetical protein [Pyrinomonadaceae bacterium]
MKNVEKFYTIADSKIKEHQQEFADALLADLKTMSRNGWSPFVVSVYENARRNDSTTTAQQQQDDVLTPTETQTEPRAENEPRQTETKSDKPNFQPVTGAIKMSDLVGKWNKGTVSSYGYRNTVTNDYTSG